MLKKELLELIKEVGENGEVDQVIEKSELANKLGGLDAFKQKIINDKTFKSYIDSIKDTHLTKGLETWKNNNLQSLVDEKVKELYPEEDPKDNEMKKLKQEIDNMKKEKAYEQLKNKAFKIANEKELPVEIIENFIGKDEETTVNNLDNLNKVLSKRDETMKTNLLKGASYKPPQGNTTNYDKNPWSKEYFNLTKQAQLLRDDPVLAAQYKSTINN